MTNTEKQLSLEIDRIKSELRILRRQLVSPGSIQNPFWYGIVLGDVAAAASPATGHTNGLAELLIPNKIGAADDLKASGNALPFVNRWSDLELERGTLVLFARDWNKSLIVTPGCEGDWESLLTLDENGEPI